MLYQYVKRYLKKNFKQPTEQFSWSLLNNIEFFTYIENRYTYNEFNKEISEVKEAFRDFFEPVGKIVFRYKEESGIKFKIVPYYVHPQDSKHLKSIIKIIRNHTKYIQYPYQGQSDQIAILGKIRRDINREVHDTQESIYIKNLVKYAIRIALELSDKDIVTQLKRKYIVKIFEKNKVLESEVKSPKKRSGALNRYNGYTKEEVNETYRTIFNRNNTNITAFLENTMKNVLSNSLNFRKIDNNFYEKNALKCIKSAITEELKNYMEVEEDYLHGMAGYIMRENFYNIHELMAINLIECIYDKDKNADRFLLYYDGSTILINNQKYIIPSLETHDGQKWNNASLIGICNLWMNTKRKKQRYEHKLVEINEKINDLEKSLLHIKPEMDTHEQQIKVAEENLYGIEKINTEIHTKLKYISATSLNSSEYIITLEKFKKSNLHVIKAKDEVKMARAKLVALKDSNASSFQELEFLNTNKTQLLHDLRAQDLNIDTKNSQIDPIIDSVVKVLMSRTNKV